MIETFFDFEVTPLTRLAEYVLSSRSAEYRQTLLSEVRTAFEAWKDSLADRNGNITMVWGKSLLGPSFPETRPASGAKPVDAAGPGCFNEIDLAFKLWGEQDRSFASVIESAPVESVFAVLIIDNCDASNFRSLVRAYTLLAPLQIAAAKLDASVYQEALTVAAQTNKEYRQASERQTKGLKEGPALGAAANTNRRLEVRTLWASLAAEYLSANPRANAKRLAAYIQPRSKTMKKKSYSILSIEKWAGQFLKNLPDEE